MIVMLVGIGCMLLGLVALALQRFYSSVPIRELKRLSSRGDSLAQHLYRPVAYGASLRVLLWLLAGLFISLGVVVVSSYVPAVVLFVLLGIVLFLAFVWIPSMRLTFRTAQFAQAASGTLTAVVRRFHPLLDAVARAINKAREFTDHSRLYEKEDLTHLLSKQKDQHDNRISLEDIELTHRALQFSDKHAADIAQTRKDTLLIDASDSIGPILLDQLHKAGQSSFLVYKEDREDIVGSLLMRDAINARHGGKVLDLVRNDLCYVHEDYTLRQVLAAFQKTGHHTAIVINSFEEFVGIITLDRLVEELVGETAADTSENFENRSAVAAYRREPPRSKHDEEQSETPDGFELSNPDSESADELPASPEATEVVK